MAAKSFMGVYDRPDRQYDPRKEGFGHAGKWKRAFRQRMSLDDARDAIKQESPYTILGVSMSAGWKEIKSAYRRLATQWHPDRNHAEGAEAMMKKINAAFTILEDRFGLS